MKKIVIIFLTFFTLQGFAQEVSKQYDKIGKFNKGLAIVWKNGHCGILSQDGREIVKPTYDKIGSFGNDGDRAIQVTRPSFNIIQVTGLHIIGDPCTKLAS